MSSTTNRQESPLGQLVARAALVAIGEALVGVLERHGLRRQSSLPGNNPQTTRQETHNTDPFAGPPLRSPEHGNQ